DALQQALAVGRGRHPARPANQQGIAQPLLQRTHLVAQRTDREVERFGGAGEVAVADRRDEALQRMQRRSGHLESCSSQTCEKFTFWPSMMRLPFASLNKRRTHE